MAKRKFIKDKYAVGQLVRIIKTHENPTTLGRVVRITAPRTWLENEQRRWYGYETDLVNERGEVICPQQNAIEPVDYDGDQPSTWSKCAWRPRRAVVKLYRAEVYRG